MRKRYTIRLAAHEGHTPPEVYRAVAALDRECFPVDSPAMPADNLWWLAVHAGQPVGFCGVATKDRSVPFLSRLGVSKKHVGQGLGKRLVSAACAYVARLGHGEIRTYVAVDNLASANVMIAAGFRLYAPRVGARGWLYFRKELA